jgi:hypothetical protein
MNRGVGKEFFPRKREDIISSAEILLMQISRRNLFKVNRPVADIRKHPVTACTLMIIFFFNNATHHIY